MIKEFISNSQEDTFKVAKEFVKTLKAGDIVLLEGDLGAGKTAFVKGVIDSLHGNCQEVTSPTFTLVNEYKLKGFNVYHFDFYRIESVDELYNIGIEEYFYSNNVCFIEWPERALELFDSNCKKISIFKLNDNSRKIVIE